MTSWLLLHDEYNGLEDFPLSTVVVVVVVPSVCVCVVGSHSSGGACTAAAFLREFVTAPHWAHLDIAGVMGNKDEVPYLRKGMSGRPTRTLVEFAARLAQEA